MKKFLPSWRLAVLLLIASIASVANADLASTIKAIKPSVVGVGVFTPLGQPQNQLKGSGFVIGDGRYIVTNHHVIADELDGALQQQRVVFVGAGKLATVRKANLVAMSATYDLAVLKIDGPVLPAMQLADADYIAEGSDIAFTGFPIGAVLGLYPVTHRGIIASITPVVVPAADSRQIDIRMLKRLRDPYLVYQLDATAYPGNSGSALYDATSGKVVGIINKVFVQGTKENTLTNPSGITYAIPVKHLLDLLAEHQIPAA